MQIAVRLSELRPNYSGWRSDFPLSWGFRDPLSVSGKALLGGRTHDCYFTTAKGRDDFSAALYVLVCESWWDGAGLASFLNSKLYKNLQGAVGLVGFGRPETLGWFCVWCREGKAGFTDCKLGIIHSVAEAIVPQLADWYSRKGSDGFNSTSRPFDIIDQQITNGFAEKLSLLRE